jgi:Na+-driven multidrug efflux pump
MMLQNANNTLGTHCAAAFTTAMRIKMFFMCPFETLGIAMATFCGQNYGAGKPERILHGIKDTFIIMVSYAALTFAIIWPFARWMGTFFMDVNETEVLDNTELFLHCSVTFYLLLGSLCIIRYCIQGIGYTKLAMFSGVAEMVARILVSLFAVPTFGYIAVCLGDPTAWLAADMFLVPAFIWVWRQIRVPVNK